MYCTSAGPLSLVLCTFCTRLTPVHLIPSMSGRGSVRRAIRISFRLVGSVSGYTAGLKDKCPYPRLRTALPMHSDSSITAPGSQSESMSRLCHFNGYMTPHKV
ncbi:hypothetical protein BDV10DRAFT_157007 [Aspergillus recurvatus]